MATDVSCPFSITVVQGHSPSLAIEYKSGSCVCIGIFIDLINIALLNMTLYKNRHNLQSYNYKMNLHLFITIIGRIDYNIL